MAHFVRLVLALALVGGAVVAIARWPHLSQVETSRTPEYPHLKIREYAAPEDKVARAARKAIAALPRWKLVGGGSGAGGAEIQAEATTPVGFKSDVFVRIRRGGGRTTVSVLSRNQSLPWDFGQNARNIEAFQSELAREMFLP